MRVVSGHVHVLQGQKVRWEILRPSPGDPTGDPIGELFIIPGKAGIMTAPRRRGVSYLPVLP